VRQGFDRLAAGHTEMSGRPAHGHERGHLERVRNRQRASDLVVQALSGLLSLSGEPGRVPLKVAAKIIPYACGVSAFVGALAALRERERSGRGQLVEVACLEAAASLVLFLRAQYVGEPFPRRLGVGTVLLPCKDGYVLANPQVQTVWDALLSALSIEPDAVPDALRTPEGRRAGDPVAFITGFTSVGEEAITFRLLAVAVCRSSASCV